MARAKRLKKKAITEVTQVSEDGTEVRIGLPPGSSYASMEMDPGRTMHCEEIVNKKVDLREPDRYTIQSTQKSGKTAVKSHTADRKRQRKCAVDGPLNVQIARQRPRLNQ